jgi:hypothetical protein
VRERGGALSLALETLDELLVARVASAHDLERHVAVEYAVVGEVYLRHAAGAQRLDYLVTIVN